VSTVWAQHREVTANRLQDIALELFVLKGYPNVSVNDVSTAAGISVRTFHRYFPSKQDVLLNRQAEIDRKIIERLQALSHPESPLREIRDILIELTEQAVDLAPFRLWCRAMATAPDVEARATGESRREISHVLRRIFAEWLGVDPDHDVRPDAMSSAVMGVNAAAVTRYLESDGQADLVAIYVDAFDFLDCGLKNYLEGISSRRPVDGLVGVEGRAGRS
jgi:TetR/AcrR family transcriptional regulator, regulator of mycofactocin system